jgi:hypothetical protein
VNAENPKPSAASHGPAESSSEPHGKIEVSNKLLTVPDSERAADLFGRILASVRSANARRKERESNGCPDGHFKEERD